MPEERACHLGEGALDQVEPRAMLGCMNVLEAPGALATYRPPPWTTLHRYEPPVLHLSFGESCSNKPSHFFLHQMKPTARDSKVAELLGQLSKIF